MRRFTDKLSLGFAFSLIVLLARPVAAQTFSVGAGLGFEYFNAPSLTQFLEKRSGGITPGTYVTGFQAKANADCFVADEWAVGIDYGYLIDQANGNSYQISYSYSLPTIMVTRVLPGDNYYLRFGGGIGYHFFSMSQLDPFGERTNYSSKGIGLKFIVGFDTKLGEDFYARIEGDARAEYTGNFNAADEAGRPAYSSNLSGVGVTFGLVYYF